MSGRVFSLSRPQEQAVDPRDSVWLSASAGTGKTQVLSARVLRLLLQEDVRPEQILCLTFTKAGAAEMATRVSAVLANWVRMKDTDLAADLIAIGADNDPATRQRARTLFASVLDCPGGGLRIDTIHAFAQWLLSAFPVEAGIEPGTQPMEDRDREILAHRVLADMLVEWERDGDAEAIGALEMLSVRMGPEGARQWLMRCANAREAWFGPSAWQPPMRERVERLLGIGAGETVEDVVAWCADDTFDTAALRRVHDAYASWNTKNGNKYLAPIEQWLAASPEDRLAGCATLASTLFNDKGELKYQNSLLKQDPDIATVGEDLLASLQVIAAKKALFDLADLVTPALAIGRRYALAWDEAKRREGLVDFDDLIRQAALLLADRDMGEWIRYKLDRRIDHVLIDEAQDTNEAQWSIVDALTDDFFTGLGQRGEKLRTIFVVGDYKQAIFRFQGTSPENFAAAKARYKELLAQREANAITMRANIEARPLQEIDLDRSYRTAQDVLDFVDDAIHAIGSEQLGLKETAEEHVGDRDRPGLVTLWNPVLAIPEDAEEDADPEGPESWISAPERRMADKIARQVKQWMHDGFPLVKGGHRNAGPGDVMVLVRKRRDLAGLIVARLHAAGVPVAGVDRLRLGAPLAVKDLMAALRFAAQPADGLSLAALLVSPIFGWSQQDLLDHGYRKGRISLWDHLRKSDHPLVVETLAMLRDLLAIADFEPPQALIHWMLVGKWQARRKLTTRLGSEANDPIDELLNAALSYAASHTPSLQGFIHWFDAGEGELKRDAAEAGELVRVMTVHGSKGLQAPIVILADAAGNPHTSRTQGLELEEQLPGGGGKAIPLPDLRKEEKAGAILEAEEQAKAEEMAEHWRLLYVAMTRAEEALFIGGALGQREKAPNEDSWHARLAPLFDDGALDDPIWGARMERGERAPAVPSAKAEKDAERLELPKWARTPIGPEPRPPRPLAPSAAGEEQGADPPLPPEIAATAARRGVLMHSLLERLPDIPAQERAEKGTAWLERMAGEFDPLQRMEMLGKALAVLESPQWAELFGPDALAEVPLAATVAGQVIAGTADRLLVTESRVLVADFKTARRPPSSLEDMPAATIRQMGAYVAALEVIFPGREIGAAVLYTQTPQLIEIPGDILAANKPRLAGVQ
ncbi:double-strand break repair helicase AddA [Alteraurantiacibacter aquimixticola]|uniref:DNA 3'-5' helicase n=1 Tax=Alteraurantiacibacter aquimixticola TaxID=2489173 RepID=A0A4T3F416_9SPHN|nr:double-strand break repair helicase AddA [Alteraurantiacibacter aquimixticola]TIX52036.1 double-strand break repair helicase AddA [Alteraurantiacibacter aquimixticola]